VRIAGVVFQVMDDIQKKLALLDKQLEGGHFHRQIISTCPLLFIAIGLISGILIQNGLQLSIRLLLIMLTVFTTAAILVLIGQKYFNNPPARAANIQNTTAYLAIACFLCLGAIRLTSFRQAAPDDISNLVGDEPKLATIRGTIITEPRVKKYPDWQFARFMPSDPSCSFYARLNQIEIPAGWIDLTGTVLVNIAEPVLDLKAGDSIQAYCWLERFKPPTNPGQFDIAGYLSRRNIFIAASIDSRTAVEQLSNKSVSAFAKIKTTLSQKAMQALLGSATPDDPEQGLLQALLLGYRGNIDSKTDQAFRVTGLYHLISLSGMHFAILIGSVWWFCKLAGLMKPARSVICIIVTVIFTLIVPPIAPTIRAAIISLIFCLSIFFRRHSNPINTLSLAAIVLLLFRPTQLFEADWQLSFVAVLGILVFTKRFDGFLREQVDRLSWISRLRQKNWLAKKVIDLAITSFSVGLAAWLASAGILLFQFYTITPLVSLWTMLVSPLVSAILVLGFLKITLFFVLPTLSAILGFIVTFLSDSLIWCVKRMAEVDISQILIGHVPLSLIFFYYCTILFIGFIWFRHPFVKKIISITAVLTMVISVTAVKWQRTYRDDLILTTLDVGHGQAILAQLPGKANVLFDAGSMYKSDIGRRAVIPFLNYSGIHKIDAIIISHNDIDHINGIPEIAEDCTVGGIYANDAFFTDGPVDTNSPEGFLNDLLKQHGFEIKKLPESLSISRKADIKFLWPVKEINYDNLTDNNKSQVTLIEVARRKILLCSDIEQFAQKELIKLYPDLQANIVVVPHHGSAATLEAGFLESLNANILLCSNGQGTKTTNQRPQRQYMNNTKIFTTEKNGAITIHVGKDGTVTSDVFVR
jgi:competence protein ComEC